MPEGAVREHLAQVIAELARRFGTPGFEPHVTLLGGLTRPEREMVARTQAVARRLSPLPVLLTTPDGGGEYFRCVFVGVAENEALLAAHALAGQACGAVPASPLRPHLSLLYGHLPPATKRTVLSELAGLPWDQFEVRQLQLVRTEGAPSDWRTGATFTLG